MQGARNNMGEKVRFKAMLGPKEVNDLMRAADLLEGGAGVCYEQVVVVEWKDGEVVTPERITRAAAALREAFQKAGIDCFSVKPIP